MAERAGRREAALIRFAALTMSMLALVTAAARAHEMDEIGESWRWVSFDRESGLPSDRILDVHETPGGVPWAATTGGVAWYDGHAWLPALDEEGMPLGRAERLAPWGSDGVAAIIESEIHLLRPGKQQRVVLEFEGARQGAWAVAERAPGELLVLAGPHGIRADKLLRVRPGESTLRDEHAPAEPYQFVLASDGSAFVVSSLGVSRFHESEWSLLLPPTEHRHLLMAAEVAGAEKLVSLGAPIAMLGTWSLRDGEPPRRLAESCLALDSWTEGGIIGAFDSGAVRLLREGRWIDLLSHSERLQGLCALARGPRGDLWVGTDRGLHLYRSSSRAWETWRFPGWDLRNYVAAILPRADGSTWMGTDGGIVIRAADGSMTSLPSLNGVPIPAVTTLAEDSRGYVWAGSGGAWDGAWRFDGSTWKHFGVDVGLATQRIHAIRTLPDSRTFFLSIPSGAWTNTEAGPSVFLLRTRDGEEDAFEAWDEARGIAGSRAYDVELGADGTLWFGTNHGLLRLRDGEFTAFNRSNGLPFGRVFCIALGPDGRAYVGAQEKGLAIVGPGDEVEVITSADGLVDDDVWDLAFDDQARLWLSTRRGLGYIAGDHIAAFRGDSGLPVARTWPVSVSGGRVLAGTVGGGVAVLDLGAAKGRPPRVRLEQPVVQGNAALVRWKALGWWGEPAPARIETRFRLDDLEWSAWSAQREIMLHELAPGPHSVRVEARGLFNDVGVASAEASLVVPHPAWRQAAFLSLASAILVAAAVFAGFAYTRSRRERRALETSEERYRELVENASELVFSLDATGRIAWANRAGGEVLGRRKGELTGHDVMEAVAPESRETARDALLRVKRTGEVVTFEVTGIAKDGSRRLVEVSLGPGPNGGWQGIGRDITDRRLREEERQRTHRLESLGLLAGGVAHDFNNVLTGVVGHLGLALLEVPAESPARRRLEQVERATTRCTELARQMLDYAGRGRFVTTRLDPEGVVREAVALAETWLPRKATVIVECEDGLPAIEAEATQLQRVVDNLLRNASEAHERGEGTIRVTLRHAPDGSGAVSGSWAGTPPQGPVILVSVRDEGHGMGDETRSRAFDPFFSTRKDGRGLGLAATLGIVRAHGGAIAVDSAPGRGSTFTVALPART